MPNDNELKELIKEIAATHGITVGLDDPILVLYTLNKKLIEDNSRSQQELLEGFGAKMEEIAIRWQDDAKIKAEKTLNAALEAAKKNIVFEAHNTAKATAEAVERAVSAELAKFITASKETRRIAWMNIIAACLAIVAAGIALWASR